MKRALPIVFTAVLLLGALLAGLAPAFSTTSPGPIRPAPVNVQVRDLKTLSQQERLTLPADTKVIVGGHTLTLGELRRTHLALAASRNHVAFLKLSSLASLPGANHSVATVYKMNQNPIKLNPSPTPSHTVIVPVKEGNSGKYPLPTPSPITTLPLVAAAKGFPMDYEQFCKSVPATVCLFYPQGVTWYGQDGNNYWTIDYLVTDSSVCSQEGGFIGSTPGWPQLNGGPNHTDGCVYEYPSSQTVNFVPPPGGFKTSGWCNPALFTSTVDAPHGAVQITEAGAHNQPAEEFCFLQVTLNH
jgi:hypothetical protein